MRRSPGIVLAGLLTLAVPAAATIGTIDNVPAATLMLPYFEVDLDNPQGVNTLFSINNSVGSAVLTKVVVWSDQAIPVLNFNVYLTGYDVQTISMRDLLVLGNVPSTASAGQDPGNQVSPRGSISEDVDFPSCSGILPLPNPAISNSFRGHIQAWLTGNESPQTHNCAGSRPPDFGEGRIARGYVTVDTVSACDINFPGNWASYGPVLTDQNVIWGDWFFINPAQNFAQGDMLVHIESCPSCFTAGDHTFYGRYSGGVADDSREPLPTTWASRFLDGGPFDGGTSLLIWREINSRTEAYSCQLEGPPSWYPLDTTQVLHFDEQEQPTTPPTCPVNCVDPVPLFNATQRVSIADLLSPFPFGWVYLNLQHPDLVYPDGAAQSWVIVVMDAVGRFSVGFDPLQLDNANDPAGVLPVF